MSSGGGGGSNNTTTTTTNTPWSKARPYIEALFPDIQAQYEAGIGGDYFPGSTTAPLTPDQTAALDMIRGNALAGNPVAGAGQELAADTLAGDYLDPASNPYLRSTFNTAADAVTDRVNAQMSLAGRTGSPGAHQQTLTRNLSELANDIYGNAYEAERGRQTQMAALSPQMAQLGNYDANQLMGVGDIYRNLDQAGINEDIGRFEYERDFPLRNLERAISLYSNLGGQYGTSSARGSSGGGGGGGFSPGGLLGGGLAGAGLAGSLGMAAGGPWTLGLAGLGGLLGAFG